MYDLSKIEPAFFELCTWNQGKKKKLGMIFTVSYSRFTLRSYPLIKLALKRYPGKLKLSIEISN